MFEISKVCSAFAPSAIGSRVVSQDGFMAALATAIEAYDPAKDRIPGQHYSVLPADALSTVSAGVGKRSADPADYVIREHRGQINAYLRREKAAAVEGLAAVVYTREAYLADPDVKADQTESARIAESGATHVVVAVLASAGPRSPLTSDRFVKNLAGGNKEALAWTADEIRAKAQEIAAYYSEWSVVAD